jgi:small multidrug resistance family-3 protein
MRSILIFAAAAFCEIAGCFSFWACFRALPDRWDVLGVAICLVGACVILWGPR